MRKFPIMSSTCHLDLADACLFEWGWGRNSLPLWTSGARATCVEPARSTPISSRERKFPSMASIGNPVLEKNCLLYRVGGKMVEFPIVSSTCNLAFANCLSERCWGRNSAPVWTTGVRDICIAPERSSPISSRERKCLQSNKKAH